MKASFFRLTLLIPGTFLGMLGGCVKIPEYPRAPSISYNSVYFREEAQSDGIYLILNYKDGDGNLGLDADDIAHAPFQEMVDSAGTQVVNPNHFNIFPVLYRLVGDHYDSVLPTGYRGIFPRLRDGNQKGPIEGTIQYRMGSVNFFNEDSSIAKVKVYIQDRTLLKSNLIETPPFLVKYKE